MLLYYGASYKLIELHKQRMKKISFQYIYYNTFLSIAMLNRGKKKT